MHETLQFILRHGYVVLFGWVFAEQLGLPVPAIPILLAAGALAGSGRMNLGTAIALAVLAAAMSDLLWYELGRHRGIRVLQFLCRISLEPDSCVRTTQRVFARQGARSLLAAKFIPGLGTAAPPMAGVVGMRPSRFLVFDTLGAALWAGTYLGAGYVFSDQLESIAAPAARLGASLFLLLAGGLLAFVAWKYVRRQRFLRELQMARITPEELRARMEAGEDVMVVDLRQSLSFEADPELIPGALRFDPENLDEHPEELPRDREVILYCT
jgi:membrane protein DedA with SNARE-associated domain